MAKYITSGKKVVIISDSVVDFIRVLLIERMGKESKGKRQALCLLWW